MFASIEFENGTITYEVTGKGTPVVFLHGYLETRKIWDGIVKEFAENHRFISVDLPGHGRSGTFDDYHSMEFMAETVHAVIKNLGLKKVWLMGHSMGGYVALAFLELFPESLYGLGLIHSHPFVDSDATKEKREHEIALVEKGRKDLIIANSIPYTYAEKNRKKLKKEIDITKEIAKTNSKEGIVANLKGMLKRPDRSEQLKNTSLPVLVFAGEKDSIIPFESVSKRIPLPTRGKFVKLEESGHMGFVEEKETTLETISNFIKENQK